MSHKCDWFSDVIKEDGKIYRVITAKYKQIMETQTYKYELDVAKECLEDGKIYIRENLVFKTLGGYLVDFPGEKYKENGWYYYITPHENGRITNEWAEGLISKKIKDFIRVEKHYPDYKEMMEIYGEIVADMEDEEAWNKHEGI